MKIYLTRHGQVSHNVRKLYSNVDEDLTEIGIQQANELKERIKYIDYDAIYTSPTVRTIHTAEIINIKDKEIILDGRLKERKVGTLTGKPLEYINRKEYWNYYSTIQYGTAEKVPQFFDRIFQFLDELKTQDYKQVIIIAHSGVSRAFYAYFNGIPQNGILLDKGIKNCELKEYEL